MPRETRIQERTRRQIDAREYFEYTTPRVQVSARATDPYARPGDAPRVSMGGDGEAFRAALGHFASALQDGVKIKKLINEEDKAKGKVAAGRGEDIPEGASPAFIVGHEVIKGKAAAADLDTMLAEYHDANKDTDILKYETGQKKLIKQFMAGRSDAFMEGILSDAIGLEEKYRGAYVAHTQKRVKDEGLANIGKAWGVDAGAIIAHSKQPSDVKAQAFREMLTGAQVVGETTYKLSKNEVTKHLTNLMGRQAVQDGDPTLLKFLTLEDKHGIRPIDNPEIGKLAYDYIKAAENEKEKNTREYDKRREKAIKDVEDTLTNHIMTSLLDTNTDTRPIQELLHQYSDPTRNELGIVLDPSRVIAARKMIQSRGQGFAMQTNQEVYAKSLLKATEGKLSIEEVLGLRSQLEEPEYKSLLSAALQSSKPGTKTSQRRKDFNELRRGVVKAVGKVDPITGRYLDKNGPARETYVISRANAWWESYLENNEGKEPSSSDFAKELMAIKEQSYQFYEEQPFDQPASPPQAPAAPRGKPNTPATSTAPAASGPTMQKSQNRGLAERFDAVANKRKPAPAPAGDRRVKEWQQK